MPPLHRPALRLALIVFFALSSLLAACSPWLRQAGLEIRQVASPNFDERRPNLVILHYTSNDSIEPALHTLTDASRKVSAHYLIGRDGAILQLVDESKRAWHAGASWWGGLSDVNSLSLGIELDNSGEEAFADAQIDALLALLSVIRQRHAIPANNIIGHSDVAPTRKNDPGNLFPWKRLAEAGFGLWCEPPYPAPPREFDLPLALTALGYDPGAPAAAQAAFRLHFVQERSLTADDEKALAYCLLQKKAGAMPG